MTAMPAMQVAEPNSFEGQRVLVTGHTGFKGAWLVRLLRHLGAEVHGLALRQPDAKAAVWTLAPDLVEEGMVDLLDAAAVQQRVVGLKPQFVFHLAAQALVRVGYEHPAKTWAVNVQGTANLLEALGHLPQRPVVVISTTDKVYRNQGLQKAFQEDDELGGSDPYSASKSATELLVSSWPERDGIATARSGNVIGGGDRGVDRLIPDAIRSLESREPLVIRYPDATRPWQHVLEPLMGYLAMSRAIRSEVGCPPAVNFAPDPRATASVSDILERLGAALGGLPWVADSETRWREASHLALDSSLAHRALGWQPRLSLDEAISWTCEWYAAERVGGEVAAIADRQIDDYLKRW